MMRNLHLLTASRTLSAVAYFMLLPTLAIILLQPPFSLPPHEAGVAMMMYAIGDRGLSLLCLPLVARAGHRRLQVFGYLCAGLACLVLSVGPRLSTLVIILLVMGGGLSLAGTASRSYLGAVSDRAVRLRGFTHLYIGINAGAILGALLVFALPFRTHSTWIFFIVSALLGVAAIIASALDHESSTLEPSPSLGLSALRSTDPAIRVAWRNGLRYVMLSALAYFFYIQLYELVPAFIERTTGPWRWFGWVFAANGIIILLLQRPLTTLFQHVMARHGWQLLAAGFGCFAVGALSLGLVWVPEMTWFAMLCFTFGEMVTIPLIDFLISERTAPAIHVYCYALNNTAMAAARAISLGLGLQYLGWVLEGRSTMALWWIGMAVLGGGVTLVVTLAGLRAATRAPAATNEACANA